MDPARRRNLGRLLNPRHIAFIGGSDAAVAIGEARRIGFAGTIWPVNPCRDTLAELACHASLDDLPEAPDAVFMAIPSAGVPEAAGRLAAMGAGGIVCYSAGFGEAGEAGRALQRDLLGGLRDTVLVGPNCYGIINYLDRAALWPFAHGGDCPGYGAAIVTQSGMLSSDITMCQRSLPLTHMISTGNQADLRIPDFVEWLGQDRRVRAIGLHIEGLGDIGAFHDAALSAIRQGTAIVALKTGSSRIGKSLTMSHTGSLSGTTELYSALFARTGVIEVTSPAQLLETLKYLCVAGAPAGRRVNGFTCSGGGAAMLADHAERIGLEFPAFAPAECVALAALLPPIATVSNPLDYTTPIWGQPDLTAPVFARAMQAARTDAALLVQDYPAPGLDGSRQSYLNDALAFASAACEAELPAAVCATFPENIDKATRDCLISHGVAPMQGIHEALNAIRDAGDWGDARRRILAAPPLALGIGGAAVPAFIDEAAGKAMLARWGLSVPRGGLTSGEDAANAAARIGFPVALKMMGPRLAHKTEAGAVALGLGDEAAVARAVRQMRRAVAKHDPGAVADRFLVEAMAPPPVVELILGIRHDPQFGFAMTLGGGGILVELLDDVRTVLLPASAADIAGALAGLKISSLLDGYRGRPVVDRARLAGLLANLGDQALRAAEKVAEIEINPLFVYPGSVLAVDALVHLDLAER